jgi:hypothetical protein
MNLRSWPGISLQRQRRFMEDRMTHSRMGTDKVRGYPQVGKSDSTEMDEQDRSSERQGPNRLRDNDQKNAHSRRPDMPDELAKRPKGPAQPQAIPSTKQE